MRSDKKPPLKSDKKVPPKVQKKGSLGYNKKSALLEDAITQMNAGKYVRASSALKDLLALDPLNAEARRLFATLHLRLGSLMSARTAFESLAREAMERQDYWLAESLLREYLTAGPRYVPFLEMLGRVYEEKGDVMAAVAEYGKAVEVLLEDPDTDKPNHPSDLFARIRSIAPGSPVSFRLAAMFDTVTGQVLQTTPQPAVPAAESESAQAAEAAAPPWEHVEASPCDVPGAQDSPVSPEESPTDGMESVVPPASPIEALGAIEPEKSVLDHNSASDTPDSHRRLEPPVPVEPSLSMVDSTEETSQPAAESEPPGIDLLPAVTGETEVLTPTASPESSPETVSLVEAGAGPIAQAPSTPAPMPWDQVEDVAVVIPPATVSQESPVPHDVPQAVPEPESVSIPDVEAVPPAIEVLAETGSHPIAHAPASPAPMPWDQVAEEAMAIPSPPESQVSMVQESIAAPSPETGLPQAPASASAPQTIEVLSQTGSHPIVEAPVTPASMPWDQVEENPIPIPPPIEPSTSSVVELVPESSEKEEESSPTIEAVAPVIEDVMRHAEAPPAPPSASSSSEITSSGLSWEEILAAVAAMQSSPAQTLPSAEPDPAPATSAAADSVEMTATFYEAPAQESSLDSGSASPTLSGPMPWEQIEVENVTIPSQEPEPEFGSVSLEVGEAGESGGVPQDSTLMVPAVPETSEPAAQAESLTVGGEPVPEVADESARGFRLFSPDSQNQPHNNPLPVATEAHEATLAESPTTLPELEPSAGRVKEESTAVPLRLLENETIPPTAAGEPARVQAEPVTEFTIDVTRDESVAAEPTEPLLQVEQSLPLMRAQALTAPADFEPVEETVAVPTSMSPVEDHTGALAEPIVPEPQAEPPADLPAIEIPPVASLEPVANLEEHEVVDSRAHAAEVPSVEVMDVQTEPVQELPPVTAAETSIVIPADDSPQVVESPHALESVQPEEPEQPIAIAAEPAVVVDTEVVAPALPAPSDTTPSDGLHILWDNASSAPTPKPSTGNMLTRWLKKSAEPVTPEVSAAPPETPAPVEPLASVAPQPVEETVPAAVVAEQTSEPIEQPPAALADEPPQRPKPIQPAGRGVWSRVGEAAASLVGAGVSTTRSLVVLVLAVVGLVLLLVGGTVAAVTLTWLVLEEQPSAAYRNMTSVPQQTLQDSSRNGYLLLLGLGAAESQDPMQAGMDRRVEGADRAFTHTCLTGEGYLPEGNHSASAEATGQWMKTADPAMQMQLDANGVKKWVSQAEVSLGRYRQWLNKPFEDVGYGQPISPNCGLILETHRLYLADGFAQDVETGVGRLETDLTAWRTVLGQAKSLPVKMLASAAMNDDVVLMSGLLQRPDLDERYISRIAKLARPLEQPEQSLRWPMQSQFVLATKTVDEAVSQDRADTRPIYGAIAAALPLPKQRRFNAYAEYYDAAGKAAADGRYADLPKQSQFVRIAPYSISDMVVNPIESLVGVDPLPAWETYGGRVLETDARLRLVSLQAWLRRTPPEQDLLTRLAKAGQGLYDPFSGLPMLVNMKKGVLYSVGPDLKDDDAHERLDLVVRIPSVSWVGGKKPADGGKAK